MKKLKKIIAGLVASAALISLAACGSSSSGSSDSSASSQQGQTVEQIKKAGKIRIATFGDLPPYGYVKNDGTRAGYDVALGNKLAEDLGVKVDWVQVNADGRVDALKSDKVDLVLANFTVTDERKQVVDFASPYMKVSIGVVSPDSAKITDADLLKGKTLAVTKGTTAETYFTQNYPDVTLQKYDSKTQQFQAFKDGRVNALADDNTYLYAWAKENPGYTVGVKTLGEESTIAPAVKKGNADLLKWVNSEIKTLTDDGFFEQAYQTELAPSFTNDIKPEDVIITK
ncbi:transporter substrate-binding domain-containing protein [Bifidobacterium tissieri]|uniref:Transporter substrate-binding domain-containing protein n=1 Tax=Bifidobacterium tissieri TaxID=1630162 RepID=A0A5M9ZWQ8_9BIFI|nr:transporter substrate-binding domain-containing protein [Bifidobacterium tissieri]KAA8832046.1 transporter substrate-binding domain-containing protein [Bifidobacterium tissieri]KAA8832867.1 transporter substrate-binding domain-containing protein [Bifidobacterium tissieri]